MTEQSATTAMADLIAATTDVELHLGELAEAYPNVVAFGAVVAGRVCGTLVLTPSVEGDHWSTVVGAERMRKWAGLIANLPDELLDAFLAEFNLALAARRP